MRRLVLLLVVGVLGPACVQRVAQATKAPALTGPLAPTLGGAVVLNSDRPLDFKGALQGRVVVLFFFSGESAASRASLPVLRTLQARFGASPVQVVGVFTGLLARERDEAAARLTALRDGVDFPVLVDAEGRLFDAWGLHGVPAVGLVDAQGRALATLAGVPDAELLTRAVELALDDGARTGVLAQGSAEFQRADVTPSPGGLAFPGALAALGDGRLAIADTGHHRVVIAAGDGQVEAVAGSGREGFADGPLATAAFRSPRGVAGSGEVLFVADTGNHAVRKVDLRTGVVTTVAGDGRMAFARVRSGEAPTQTSLNAPVGLALHEGALFIALAGTHQLARLTLPSGPLTVLAGTGHFRGQDGTARQAAFAEPTGLAIAGDSLLVAEARGPGLRRVSLGDFSVSTVGVHPGLQRASAVAVAVTDGGVLVLDTAAGSLLSVSAEGAAVALVPGLESPEGLVADGARVWVADTGRHRVLEVDGRTGAAIEVQLRGLPGAEVGRYFSPLAVGEVAQAGVAVELALPAGHSLADAAPHQSLALDEGVSAALVVDGAVARLRVDFAPAAPEVARVRTRVFVCAPEARACRVDERELSMRRAAAGAGSVRVQLRE